MRFVTGLVAAALLAAGVAAGAEREFTPAEDAAATAANDAIARQDYVAARALLASPDLAQLPQAYVILAQLHEQGLGGPKDEAAALQALRRAAELGDAASMLNLGKWFALDESPAVRAEGRSWLTAAANLGVAKAYGHLGMLQWEENDAAGAIISWKKGAAGDDLSSSCLGMAYTTGEGIAADPLLANHEFDNLVGSQPSEGFGCVEVAAERGNAWAQYLLGLWLNDKQSARYAPTEALGWFDKASEQEHLRATVSMAEMLDKGDGVPRDASRAYDRYLRAVSLGETRFYPRLGEMALAGDGYPKSVLDTVRFFEKEEYGNHNYQLGLIHAGGEGWPRNMTKAVAAMSRVVGEMEPQARAWLKAQADAGNAEAQYAYAAEIEYDQVETDTSGRQLSYDEQEEAEEKIRKLARSYYEKAAGQRLPKAMYRVAQDTYENNSRKLSLMRAAADAGFAPAMLELSTWHTMGWVGLPKDEAMARAWEERAARTGDGNALGSLGERSLISASLKFNGYRNNPALLGEVQELYRRAARYYEAAHVAGYEGAPLQLARIYENDLPGIRNDQLSFKWYRTYVDERGMVEEGMRKLSQFHETGRGTPVDLVKAWFWAKMGKLSPYDVNERADSLWLKLTPAQQGMAERHMISCKLRGYRKCSI